VPSRVVPLHFHRGFGNAVQGQTPIVAGRDGSVVQKSGATLVFFGLPVICSPALAGEQPHEDALPVSAGVKFAVEFASA